MELNKILAEQDVLMHLPNVSGGSFQECHIGGGGVSSPFHIPRWRECEMHYDPGVKAKALKGGLSKVKCIVQKARG